MQGMWKETHPHAKSWLIGKDSDAGRDWGQEEKGTWEIYMQVRKQQLELDMEQQTGSK